MPTTLITDSSHYTTVLDRAMKAKHSLWIGTADIKDLYVLQGKTEKPFLGVLAELLGKGVEVRLIHAKEPGPNFRADFDRYPRLAKMLKRVMCPRVHFIRYIYEDFGMIFRSSTSKFIAKSEVVLHNFIQK